MVFDLPTQLVSLMSWVEGPFRAFWTLELRKAISQRHNSMFYTKIDDHGVHRGNTGWIHAWWRRKVASRVALDLPYWAMSSAPYHLIRMAIEMASKVDAFFSVINFISCMNVAKRPWYGQLKIKVSYTIVCYYVLLCPDKNTIVTVFSLD